MEEEKITLLIDPVEKKVGCVMLQAAYGSDYQSINFDILFPVETWLIHPTENLQLYSITLADVEKLSVYLKERIKNV